MPQVQATNRCSLSSTSQSDNTLSGSPETSERIYQFTELLKVGGLVRTGMSSGLGDEVYHINPGPGSFSTRYFQALTDDFFDEATIADSGVSILDERNLQNQSLAVRLQRLMLDLSLAIIAGNRLILHRAITDDDQRRCDYSCCLFRGGLVTGSHLYVHVDTDHISAAIGEIRTTKFIYHLSCLEALWQGNHLQSALPSPVIVPETHTQFGSTTQRRARSQHLHQSPHSMSEGSLTQDVFHSSYSDGVNRMDSPQADAKETQVHQLDHYHSTYTTRPVNRFQHLAEFVQIGENLSAKQTATIRLWQATSSFQIATQMYQARRAARLASSSVHLGAAQEVDDSRGVGSEDLWDLEELVKLRAMNCRSKNLSEVLDLATWS